MKHILHLEDDSDTRKWFSELLIRAFGEVRIIEADSIGRAIDIIDDQSFNIAIVDIYLHDGCGLDFIARLKKLESKIFCVVLTAYDESEAIFDALRAGADGYLLKYQDKERLARLLEGIREGSPPLSPSIARRIIKHFSKSEKPGSNYELSILTRREKDVLFHIAKGMTRKETARLLGIRPSTVAGYIKHVYEKLDIGSRAEAALEADRMGLI